MNPYIAIPALLALIYRAWSRKSLTPLGILTAGLVGIAHALHPWSVFFALLAAFFLAGTAVTKVKHETKARLTLSASGASGGEGPRTHVQVLANSGVAAVLILLHAWQLRQRGLIDANMDQCWIYGGDVLVVGAVANYAAVAADTFSSELGILSRSQPRLITSPTLRRVPPGTNGGVTSFGLIAGLGGAFIMAITAASLLPFCSTSTSAGAWNISSIAGFIAFTTIWGGLGSVLDSYLGGWLQASVIDVRSGKVVEGAGGRRVLISNTETTHKKTAAAKAKGLHGEGVSGGTSGVSSEAGVERRRKADAAVLEAHSSETGSRKVLSGSEILDNNGVNVLMALIMSVGGMVVSSWYWEVPLANWVTL